MPGRIRRVGHYARAAPGNRGWRGPAPTRIMVARFGGRLCVPRPVRVREGAVLRPHGSGSTKLFAAADAGPRGSDVPAPASRVRRDLQGLRAIAVVAVVATHLTGWPRGGFVGVDVFFVLSGFLVTGILLSDLDREGTVRLGAFFARRVKRLLPAALVVLTAVVGSAFLVFSPVRAESTLTDALSAAGLVSNWHFGLEGRDYFASTGVSPLQHFWSLSVEEQFSVVWPLLVLLAVAALPTAARRARGGRVAVGLLAGAVVVASGIVAVVQTPADPSLAYFSTLTRAGELATGAVIASAAPVLARIPAAARGLLAWAGVAVILAAFFVIDPAGPFPAPAAALPVIGAALVIGGGIGGDPRHRHLFVLTNPLAVTLGDLSYSLYLWHLPVIVFAGVLLARARRDGHHDPGPARPDGRDLPRRRAAVPPFAVGRAARRGADVSCPGGPRSAPGVAPSARARLATRRVRSRSAVLPRVPRRGRRGRPRRRSGRRPCTAPDTGRRADAGTRGIPPHRRRTRVGRLARALRPARGDGRRHPRDRLRRHRPRRDVGVRSPDTPGTAGGSPRHGRRRRPGR